MGINSVTQQWLHIKKNRSTIFDFGERKYWKTDINEYATIVWYECVSLSDWILDRNLKVLFLIPIQKSETKVKYTEIYNKWLYLGLSKLAML